MPRLCGHCGEAVTLIISIFTYKHRSGFNLEFETLFESIWQVVADLWQRKGKVVASKTALLLFYSNVKKVSFQRKSPSTLSKFSLYFSTSEKCSLMNRQHTANPLKNYQKILTQPYWTISFKTYFILTLLENNGSATFEAATNFAFLCHKSATTCPIISCKVSNSISWSLTYTTKVKLYLNPQLFHSSHTNRALFVGHPAYVCCSFLDFMID